MPMTLVSETKNAMVNVNFEFNPKSDGEAERVLGFMNLKL